MAPAPVAATQRLARAHPLSLRLQLLLAASLLVVVPLAGYRFVLAMEAFLRANQAQAAAGAAHTLAIALESRPELLPDPRPPPPGPHLYVHPLAAPPQVDGYADDWWPLLDEAQAGTPVLRAAAHGDALFLLLALPAHRRAPPALRLLLEDAPGFRRAWLLATAGPGPTPAHEVPPAPGATRPAHRDDRIRAAVGRSRGRLVVEMRLPLALRAPRLGVELLAAAAPRATPAGRVPEAGSYALVLPPPGLATLLRTLAPAAGRRLRVTDRDGRVLAEAGELDPHAARGRLAALLDGLLEPDEDALLSLAPASLRLEGPELAAALGGSPAARLRGGARDGARVVTAAHPLRRDGRVAGALVLEESTSPIQALGRRALLELLGTTALAFAAGIAGLLLVAGRAARRLRTLRDRAAAAVDAAGRVRAAFEPPAGGDEIGDLGRSFAATVSRLEAYQDYLERLAQRLSHELRTPLAVIRTSLDNLSLAVPDPDPELARCQARIREGVDRLDGLIRRMSEAARLEHAISDTETARLELAPLLRSAVQAHAAAWPEPAVELVADAGVPLAVTGSAELLLQALDKLLANARDFAAPGSTVRVRLERVEDRARIAVDNRGRALPAMPPERLFDSLVSARDGDDGGLHLGLGLHVVRLVAEFHRGRAFAENLPDGGARVGIELPLAA